MDCACIEMPKYQSHKYVWALKIKDIIYDADLAETEDRETDRSAIIYPVEERYASLRVTAEYLEKHNPHVGGYFVLYEDGYKSFSPAKPFESGYTLVK